MKKVVVLILFILIVFTAACANTDSNTEKEGKEKSDIYSRAIMVEGDVYTSTEKSILIVPFEDIIKETTSQVERSKLPKKEGEVNFTIEDGKYAKINKTSEREEENYVAVLIESEWIKFMKNDK
ncbi:MAG: hypothetical protein GX752_02965 [Clostridium sp.]|nr:hypothetical protein [Clostridium sp.]